MCQRWQHPDLRRWRFLGPQTGFKNLQSALEASGFTVTALPGQTQLPSDISAYAEIWHYGIDEPSESDQQTLITFAKSGRGVFLTGERPCCETENQADATIINSLIVSVGGIGVGGLGDIGSCSDNEAINQTAVGNVATYSNALTTWHPACPGGLSNVTASNVFARGPDGTPVAAVWDSGDVIGGGKLAILMDVNWAQDSYKDASTMPDVAQNIAAFLHEAARHARNTAAARSASGAATHAHEPGCRVREAWCPAAAARAPKMMASAFACTRLHAPPLPGTDSLQVASSNNPANAALGSGSTLFVEDQVESRGRGRGR